jgi:drug/metabolite transporter (DMT)-like permease
MSWFWLSVACSSINFLYFRSYPRWGVNTLQAVAINYFACVVLGLLLLPQFPPLNSIIPWLPWAVILGGLYILMFWLIGRSTQLQGVATTVIAAKLSMVIPAVFAFWLFGDQLNLVKALALTLAIPAVWLSTRSEKTEQSILSHKGWILPVLIFTGGGLADTLIKFTQSRFLHENDPVFFLIILFGSAAFLGSFSLLYQLRFQAIRIQNKSLFAGIALGITNFLSVYGLINALKHLPASTLFPLNNLATILLAALLAAWLFKEKLYKRQRWGVLLALFTMLLLLWA